MRTVEFPSALHVNHAKALAYQPDPGERFYALTGARVLPGTERTIVVHVRDHANQPAVNIHVTQEWPDGHETFPSDAAGQVTFHLGPGSRFTPPRGGPHRVYVGIAESLQSDLAYSLGSPHGQLLVYELTYTEQEG